MPKNILKDFLMIWLDGDEQKVSEIINNDGWVEMTASRLSEVLEKYSVGDVGWKCKKCGTDSNTGYRCSWCESPKGE